MAERYIVSWRVIKSDWPALLVLALMVAGSLILYPCLPDIIPTHWNAGGEIDGYSSRLVGVFLMPGITVLMYLLLLYVPLIDPKRNNYPRFASAYRGIRLGLVLFMGAMHALILTAGLGSPVPIGRLMPLLLGMLMILIGIYLPQIEHNYFVGIRTPWTLADEEVWHRTHRMGGRFFILAGLLCLLGIFLPGSYSFVLVLVAILGASLAAILYSLLIFQQKRRNQS